MNINIYLRSTIFCILLILSYNIVWANGETLTPAETEAELQRASDAASAGNPTWEEAAANNEKAMSDALKADANKASSAWKITTITSEKVPGATCVCIAAGAQDNVPWDWVGPTLPWKWEAACGNITTRKYKCTTEAGMTGFQKVFAQIIRFVINIVMLLGVLAVVGLGIAWSFAGWDDMKMKSSLKTWAINLVIGFIILFMFRYILQFLAPWIYK